jgi:low molecular weight protein-tyrosine phosphatase
MAGLTGGGVYASTRALYDRALHARRTLAARQRLANAATPQRILVVCQGNICRSPYLQHRLQQILADVNVSSAGFAGSDRPVPRRVIEVGIRRGVDLSAHRSQPLTQTKVDAADLVVVMDAEQERRFTSYFRVRRDRVLVAGDVDSRCDGSRAILDPVEEPIEVIEATFARLDRCAAAIGDAILSSR